MGMMISKLFFCLLVSSLYDCALNSLWTGRQQTSSCRLTAAWRRWNGPSQAPPPPSGCWSPSALSAWSTSAVTETTPTNPPSATCLHGYILVKEYICSFIVRFIKYKFAQSLLHHNEPFSARICLRNVHAYICSIGKLVFEKQALTRYTLHVLHNVCGCITLIFHPCFCWYIENKACLLAQQHLPPTPTCPPWLRASWYCTSKC